MVGPVLVLAALALAGLLAFFWLYTPDIDRATLEAKYLARPTDLVALPGGGRLHVRDTGPRDAPALILIHGFAASLQTWDAWAADLERDHRVVRFDLPGSGLSDPDPAGDYSDEASMARLIALQDALGLARATVVGHSIGGRIAWRFAARHPERVDRLVLLDPDGFASPGIAYGRRPQVPTVLRAMRFCLPKSLLRMNLKAAYADPTLLTDALLTRYHDLILAPGVRAAMLARLEQTVLVEPEPLLRRITAPTLILWGRQDALIPFAGAERYRELIPHARLVAFAGVGHLPQEEAPAASLAALRDFLDSTAVDSQTAGR